MKPGRSGKGLTSVYMANCFTSRHPVGEAAPAMLPPGFQTARFIRRSRSRPQVGEGLPENLIHKGGKTSLVGMGKEPQSITDIIEAELMRQLHKNHRRQMAPDTE